MNFNKDLSKFWKMPREQRVHTEKRIIQLENNIREYQYKKSLAKNQFDNMDFQLNKTIKELERMIEGLK